MVNVNKASSKVGLESLKKDHPNIPPKILEEFLERGYPIERLDEYLDNMAEYIEAFIEAPEISKEEYEKSKIVTLAKMAVDRLRTLEDIISCSKGTLLPTISADIESDLVAHCARYKLLQIDLNDLESKKIDNWIEIKKRRIKKELDAIDNWFAGKRKHPTTWDEKILEDYPSKLLLDGKSLDSNVSEPDADNCFIRSSDFWLVRFNGGEKTHINASRGARTLAEYLRNPNKNLDRVKLYLYLHGPQIPGVSLANEKQFLQESDLTETRGLKEEIDENIKRKTEKYVKELIKGIKEFRKLNFNDEAREKENELKELKKTVGKCWGGSVQEDGNINWFPLSQRTPEDKLEENIRVQLRRLVKEMAEKEKYKYLNPFAEHLKKFLLNQDYIYCPPDDFPSWGVKV